MLVKQDQGDHYKWLSSWIMIMTKKSVDDIQPHTGH